MQSVFFFHIYMCVFVEVDRRVFSGKQSSIRGQGKAIRKTEGTSIYMILNLYLYI